MKLLYNCVASTHPLPRFLILMTRRIIHFSELQLLQWEKASLGLDECCTLYSRSNNGEKKLKVNLHRGRLSFLLARLTNARLENLKRNPVKYQWFTFNLGLLEGTCNSRRYFAGGINVKNIGECATFLDSHTSLRISKAKQASSISRANNVVLSFRDCLCALIVFLSREFLFLKIGLKFRDLKL